MLSCQSIKYVQVKPVLPPLPAGVEFPKTVNDGNEKDELHVIMLQAHYISYLWEWIFSVDEQINEIEE